MRPPLDMGIMICKPISRSQFFLQLTRVETIENPSRFRVYNFRSTFRMVKESDVCESMSKVVLNPSWFVDCECVTTSNWDHGPFFFLSLQHFHKLLHIGRSLCGSNSAGQVFALMVCKTSLWNPAFLSINQARAVASDNPKLKFSNLNLLCQQG